MPLIPLIKTCGIARVGIRRLWLIDGLDVSSIAITDGVITSITKTGSWANISFEKNTCYLSEEKKRVGNRHVVTQKIEFSLYGVNEDMLYNFHSLNNNGTLHALLYGEDGKYRYVGIDIEGNTWSHTDLRTSDGINNTNASSDESHILTESLLTTSFNYAPFASESLNPDAVTVGLSGDDNVVITGDDGQPLQGDD